MAEQLSPGGTPPRVPHETGRTYEIRTYGCQMNAHDSERLAGLLDEAGYQPAGDGEAPGSYSDEPPF